MKGKTVRNITSKRKGAYGEKNEEKEERKKKKN